MVSGHGLAQARPPHERDPDCGPCARKSELRPVPSIYGAADGNSSRRHHPGAPDWRVSVTAGANQRERSHVKNRDCDRSPWQAHEGITAADLLTKHAFRRRYYLTAHVLAAGSRSFYALSSGHFRIKV